jgi:hypothetical protein
VPDVSETVSVTFIRCCRDEYYINEREREVESIGEGWVKVKCHGTRERRFIVGREKEHPLLEVSQASPARPFDNSRVKVKMLQWLETVA